MVSSHRSERPNEIAIIATNNRLSGARVPGIRDEVGCQIDIRLFLRELEYLDLCSQ